MTNWDIIKFQIETLLLAQEFENFKNKCIEAPGLAWQACLKKISKKIELLTDIDMLLMVEKEIREGICHAIYRYAAGNNTYIKNYDEDIESSYIIYLDISNLYGWEMSHKLPVDGFEWV